MITRKILSFLLFLSCYTCFITSSYGEPFTSSDLAGLWYGHHVVTGDSPADDPRWGYGTVVINNSGGYTATWTSPTHTNEVTSGALQISAAGMITVNSNSKTHGVMDSDKNLMVLLDWSNDASGNDLNVLVKQKPGTSFSTGNLAGTWDGHHIVSGDAPGDDPRWGYGKAVIGSSGIYTATWTSPSQTNEVTSGTIQISSNGVLKIDNKPLTHGIMSDSKDLIVFIDGTSQSKGNALTILTKRKTGIFTTADLAGDWYGHHVVSGDAPTDDPRWGHGKITINNSGNFTAFWTSENHINEVSSGNIQISSKGIITINSEALIHGVMSSNKNFIVFTDGSLQSKGNAMTIMVRTVPYVVQSGANFLLLR